MISNMIFRQICFADFAHTHHPCLSLCVSLCVLPLPILITPVSRCVCPCVCYLWRKSMFPFSKILKQLTYINSNISSRMVPVPFFYSLTFIFKVKTFGMHLFLWLSCKWWEIKQTLQLPSDRKLSISHRTAQLRMLYIVTLTYIFKVTKDLKII